MSPASTATVVAVPARPVAVIVAGVSSPTVAVSVFVPAVVPSVQLPTVARPLASVLTVAPVTWPAPSPIAKTTSTSATGLPFASVTSTLGAVTAVPTVAL